MYTNVESREIKPLFDFHIHVYIFYCGDRLLIRRTDRTYQPVYVIMVRNWLGYSI